MIEVDRDEFGEIRSIRADGETLHSDDGETWYLLKGLIGDAPVNELPETVSFEICDRVEGSTIVIGTIPIRLRKTGNNRLRIEFEDSGTRKYWDGTIGFKTYMETKRDIVEERAIQLEDVL